MESELAAELQQLLHRAVAASRRQLDNVLQSSWDTIVRYVHYRPGETPSATDENPLARFRARVRTALLCLDLSDAQQVLPRA